MDDRLVLRFSMEPDPRARAAAVEREAAVLAMAAEVSPLEVPRVELVVPEAGCIAYGLLPGVPLLMVAEEARARRAEAIAGSLGGFLRALHEAPRDSLPELVEEDELPPAEWLDEAAGHYALARDAVPERHRAAVEPFLDGPPPPAAGALVFSHNDLGIEHVLVDPRSLEVTGVIDWSDAALVDPARDLGLILRDLGPAALDAALATYAPRDDAALRERAGFYARAALLEDLVFGLEEDRAEYVDKSIAGLTWLFPCASR